ncbi:ABC transporter permease [Roseivirga sp. E12]|uniref:ABC transporter permease n=1 Tax=Roseivirga sp. E12 TaxID=2819237 RepID=UPI001ABCFDF8|nr:ABC transporter permease [Roseivirga sp. E12]MBO3698180.1 ABC transporter permease [Roseivirga sp. E12]
MKRNNSHITPPKLAEKLLLWFLKDELAEEVQGDLDEKFFLTLKSRSRFKAKRNYWLQVLNYIRPFASKKTLFNHSNHNIMLRHNLLIGYRNLLKHKAYSFINIGGLVLGMTVALLIGLWVNDELSYNKYHDKYDRIVQVMHQRERSNGEVMTNMSQVSQLGPHLKENFGHFFKEVVMMPYRTEELLLSTNRNTFNQTGRFMQEDGPSLLGLKMIQGTYASLKEVNSIMLSESLAKKLFGDVDPIGELVQFKAKTDLIVTGIYEDIPKNSAFNDAHFICPLKLSYGNDPGFFKWDNYNTAVFGELQPGIKHEDVSTAIEETMFPHMEGESKPRAFVMPMKDWHLNSYYENGIKKTSPRIRVIWIYSAMGIFVLLLACINFMNLSTARSQQRMKEVGVRKAIGSLRTQLTRQFLSESFLFVFLAFGLSLVLLAALLPWFNDISEKSIQVPFANSSFWLSSLAFIIITAFLAGAYPAYYLSSFRPIQALRGSIKFGKGRTKLRQVLVVFQFTISIALIIGTITIHNQTQFAKNRPVGYSQEGLITIEYQNQQYVGIFNTLQTELKKMGMVTEIAQANYPLTNTRGQTGGFDWTGLEEEREVIFNTVFVRPEYGKTVGWSILQGRDFDRELVSDMQNGVIISESALKVMNLEDPIGKKIKAKNGWNGKNEYTIIGVASDMIKGSPFEAPLPALLFPIEADLGYLFIRVNPQVSLSEALPEIENTWRELAPTHPFLYSFVDDEYGLKFKEEERISSLATFFSVLTILISTLGLYGLASFVMEQRIKEVGIRKVLGASLRNLWKLLSTDFVILIGIASAIAVPISYSPLSQWLDSYEYSISLEWWIFAVAIFGSLAVTLMIVSIQTVRAAMTNPLKSLRTE